MLYELVEQVNMSLHNPNLLKSFVINLACAIFNMDADCVVDKLD